MRPQNPDVWSEIVTTDGDFRRVRRYLEELTGISLSPEKKAFVEARLSRRIRELGMDSCTEYLRHLRGAEGTAERDRFVSALTTNKTGLMREIEHFEALEGEWLPELVEARRRAGENCLRLWSAGCATGEEAWSLAAVLQINAHRSWPLGYQVLGTDVDGEALERARAGVYESQGSPDVMRRFQRCLQPEGTGTTGALRASEALRARVRFQHLNLVSIPYPLRPTFDVIFLRNTLIYFSEATRQRVVNEVVKHLAPWGILVIGHSAYRKDE